MDGWNTSFLLGWPIFRGYLKKNRVCFNHPKQVSMVHTGFCPSNHVNSKKNSGVSPLSQKPIQFFVHCSPTYVRFNQIIIQKQTNKTSLVVAHFQGKTNLHYLIVSMDSFFLRLNAGLHEIQVANGTDGGMLLQNFLYLGVD